MVQGEILKKAKADNKAGFYLSIFFLLLSFLIFVINWQFVYSVINGPFELKPEYVENLTSKRYISSTNSLIDFGKRTIGGTQIAKYMVTELDNKLLIVRLDKDFNEKEFKGKVTPLTDEIKSEIGNDKRVFPYMIYGQGNFILQGNLFIYIAFLIFVISTYKIIIGFIRINDPSSHKAIKKLKKYGQPLIILDQIETELLSENHNTKNSVIYYSQNWIVFLFPILKILPSNNLIAYGWLKDKNGDELFKVWERGNSIPFPSITTEENMKSMFEILKEGFPNRYSVNGTEFAKKWENERKKIEKAADEEFSTKTVS